MKAPQLIQGISHRMKCANNIHVHFKVHVMTSVTCSYQSPTEAGLLCTSVDKNTIFMYKLLIKIMEKQTLTNISVLMSTRNFTPWSNLLICVKSGWYLGTKACRNLSSTLSSTPVPRPCKNSYNSTWGTTGIHGETYHKSSSFYHAF